MNIENNYIQSAVSHFGTVDEKNILIKPSCNSTGRPDPVYLKILEAFTPPLRHVTR